MLSPSIWFGKRMIAAISSTIASLGATSFFWGMVLSLLSYAEQVPGLKKYSIKVSDNSIAAHGFPVSLMAVGLVIMLSMAYIP